MPTHQPSYINPNTIIHGPLIPSKILILALTISVVTALTAWWRGWFYGPQGQVVDPSRQVVVAGSPSHIIICT